MDARDQPTVAAISRGSRDAFVSLFDRTSDAVRAELALRLSDVDRAATVFAATYVEVWWLAGCHSGPELDAMEWIRQILRRRIADVEPNAGQRLRMPPAASDPAVVDLRPSCAQLELASLLGRPIARLWPV
jgi:hypothetical protein